MLQTEAKLLALEHRVRSGQLVDAVKIARGGAAHLQRLQAARLFDCRPARCGQAGETGRSSLASDRKVTAAHVQRIS